MVGGEFELFLKVLVAGARPTTGQQVPRYHEPRVECVYLDPAWEAGRLEHGQECIGCLPAVGGQRRSFAKLRDPLPVKVMA